MSAAEVLHAAPSFTRSPWTLTAPDGSRLQCEIDRPWTPRRGRCVLLPAFGLSKLDLLSPAYYLLVNGFEVVRFDPTCHVGASDGGVEDFALSKLVADIGAVLDATADERTVVVGISLSSRPALRALAGRELRGAAFLSPVVHTRRTLLEVCGEDLIGLHLGPDAPDRYSILGLSVRRRFAADCVDAGFSDLAGTLADGAACAVPTRFIVGSQDRWVDAAEAAQVAAAMPSARVVTVEGANHQMFRSPVVFQAYMTALLAEVLAFHGLAGDPVVPQFRDVVRFTSQLKKAELRARESAAAACAP